MPDRSHPISRVEQELRLYEPEVLGFPLWRLVRERVLERHLVRSGELRKGNYNRVKLGDLPGMTMGVLLSLFHLARIKRRPYLFIGFPRRRFESGVWVDHYVDPLIDSLGEDRVTCIEKTFVGRHFRPPKTRNIVYYDWVTAASVMVSSTLFFIPWFRHRKAIARLAERVALLTGEPRSRLALEIARRLTAFLFESMLTRVLIRITGPRVVIFTNRRSHLPQIQACKSTGVPTIELQHGVASVGEFKSAARHHPLLDPDLFLTFGDFWLDSEWSLPREQVETLGFKYLSDRYARHAPTSRGGKVVLLSQSHHGEALDRAFGEIVARYPEVDFVFKLHPQDIDGWRNRYPFARAKNVEIQAGATPDLFTLFEDCRCLIGIDSTGLFEASFFGVRAGLLNFDGKNRCTALEFAGEYNFSELRDMADVADLLEAADKPDPGGENPFFARFDERRFRDLVDKAIERGVRV